MQSHVGFPSSVKQASQCTYSFTSSVSKSTTYWHFTSPNVSMSPCLSSYLIVGFKKDCKINWEKSSLFTMFVANIFPIQSWVRDGAGVVWVIKTQTLSCQCSDYKNLSRFKLDNLCFLHNLLSSGFSLRILVAGERCNVTGFWKRFQVWI